MHVEKQTFEGEFCAFCVWFLFQSRARLCCTFSSVRERLVQLKERFVGIGGEVKPSDDRQLITVHFAACNFALCRFFLSSFDHEQKIERSPLFLTLTLHIT
jgi:hypothetical protein